MGRRISFEEYQTWAVEQAYDQYLGDADDRGFNLPLASYQKEVGNPEGRTKLCLTMEGFEARVLRILAMPSSSTRSRLKRVFAKVRAADFEPVADEQGLISELSSMGWIGNLN